MKCMSAFFQPDIDLASKMIQIPTAVMAHLLAIFRREIIRRSMVFLIRPPLNVEGTR